MSALEKYKKQHDVILVNKHNRDQIFQMLKQKLVMDHIRNMEIQLISPHEATQILFYCIRFAQIHCEILFEQVRLII